MDREKEEALYYFHEGTNARAWRFFGVSRQGSEYLFRVWAPRAEQVFLVGDFNGWRDSHPMRRDTDGESWELAVTDPVEEGSYYKYKICAGGREVYKADPYAKRSEHPSGTASRVCTRIAHDWQDGTWLTRRAASDPHRRPVNIYEMQFASFNRPDNGYPNFRTSAASLREYLLDMGYTHVELMPVTEYPFDGSWGYQVMGYFAPSARFGAPEDFKYLIDTLHMAGIGVIFDFVIAHFPKDEAGLVDFDGGPLYEYEDAFKKENKSWGTRCFDAGRPEVRSFLISSINYWIEEYHVDGIRFDAVSSMLYLDYDRAPGEWRANCYGDNRNLEAVGLIRQLTATLKREHPDVMLIAEESSAWEGVTRAAEEGGLGFDFKWNMGWVNDLLGYVSLDPCYRTYHHDRLTFPMLYAYTEHFILPVSHDEVVHGKGALLEKMFGDEEERLAGLRVFLLYMMSFPGKKLLFMGCEIGQHGEWDYNASVSWELLRDPRHASLQAYVRALNRFYRNRPALWTDDDSWEGFTWLSCDDRDNNVIAYRRRAREEACVYAFLNFSGRALTGYRVPADVRCGRAHVCLSSGEGGGGAAVRLCRARRRGGDYWFEVSLSGPGGVLFETAPGRYRFAKGRN